MASTLPPRMTFHRANVAKEEDWKSLMAMANEKYGHVDILVNNAGTSYRNKVRDTFQLFLTYLWLNVISLHYKSRKTTSIAASM